jgi:hypothetical protein
MTGAATEANMTTSATKLMFVTMAKPPLGIDRTVRSSDSARSGKRQLTEPFGHKLLIGSSKAGGAGTI